MHKSKTDYGRQPNRIILPLTCVGINNKQDASTLNLEKGEVADAVNVDMANTVYTRNGRVIASLPTEYTATSDNRYTLVNGTWITGSSLIGTIPALPYKLAMINNPEALLEFYNGRVYALVNTGNKCTLYCSDPWDIGTMDERHCEVATFDAVGKILGRTDDGLVVGTDRQVIYLQGEDQLEGGFTQKVVALYGALKNTLCRLNGDKMEILKMQGRVSIFTTPQGICAVGNGGSFVNLSQENFSFPYSETSCAYIREREGQVFYVVSFINPDITAYNDEVDYIEVTDPV
jgi:hypothetical protein